MEELSSHVGFGLRIPRRVASCHVAGSLAVLCVYAVLWRIVAEFNCIRFRLVLFDKEEWLRWKPTGWMKCMKVSCWCFEECFFSKAWDCFGGGRRVFCYLVSWRAWNFGLLGPSSRLRNHLIACIVLFHRLTLVAAITFLLNLQDALFMKSGLWSFNVTNASLLAEVSIQSSSERSWAIFLSAWVMLHCCSSFCQLLLRFSRQGLSSHLDWSCID